jgi:hypothetical protein
MPPCSFLHDLYDNLPNRNVFLLPSTCARPTERCVLCRINIGCLLAVFCMIFMITFRIAMFFCCCSTCARPTERCVLWHKRPICRSAASRLKEPYWGEFCTTWEKPYWGEFVLLEKNPIEVSFVLPENKTYWGEFCTTWEKPYWGEFVLLRKNPIEDKTWKKPSEFVLLEKNPIRWVCTFSELSVWKWMQTSVCYDASRTDFRSFST